MNPNGQPLIADNLRRDIELRVCINSDEREALYRFCQFHNISVSDFVRSRLFDVVPTERPPTRKPMPLVW